MTSISFLIKKSPRKSVHDVHENRSIDKVNINKHVSYATHIKLTQRTDNTQKKEEFYLKSAWKWVASPSFFEICYTFQ